MNIAFKKKSIKNHILNESTNAYILFVFNIRYIKLLPNQGQFIENRGHKDNLFFVEYFMPTDHAKLSLE